MEDLKMAPLVEEAKKATKKIKKSDADLKAKAFVPDPKLPIPTVDRVLVSRKKPETVSKGGIIIPEIAVDDETIGFVIAIGPQVGKTERTATAPGEYNRYPQPGDTVFFGQYAGTTLVHDGKEYLMMRESDIMAILP